MRRLLVRYGLAMTSVVLVAFLVPLGLLARTLAQERALAAGRQDAQSVAVFAGGATRDDARLDAAVIAVGAGARRTTVILPDGSVVGPLVPASAAIELATRGRALTARTDGGVEVLLPVVGSTGTAVVRTFVPDSELNQGVTRSWLILLGVGAVLIAGTIVAGDRVAARLSRSVRDLSGVAERLGAGDLDARVEPSGPPEVASVGRVLNGLGARVAGLLADERELVADLSHRLRTPITALRLDVEMLDDTVERERLTRHVDDLVGAVDAIVWAARHPAHESTTSAQTTCDAARVVRERARFWAVLALDQGRELQLDVPGTVVEVAVGADELGAALDVLVDNVFSHTPAQTGFRLAVRPAPAPVHRAGHRSAPGAPRTSVGPVAQVVVEDDGPGLAMPDAAERGRSGAGSTGLGLDVARRAAERAGGRLVLGASPRGGARIVMELPVPRPAP